MRKLIFLVTIVFGGSVSAQEASGLINPQTNERVELVRAYWNANVDIANRHIQCDFHIFDADSAVFVKVWGRSFFHLPLPDNAPLVNTVTTGQETGPQFPEDYNPFVATSYPLWTVADGIYDGVAYLAVDKHIELVTRNATTPDAVRIWNQDDRYFECFGVNGSPLVPTGSPLLGNTNLVELTDFSFEFPPPLSEEEEYPQITNRETGEVIVPVRGLWSYNRVAGNYVCGRSGWSEEQQSYNDLGHDQFAVLNYYHPYNGGDSIVITRENPEDAAVGSTFESIDDIELPGYSTTFRHMEITNRGYRLWENSDSFYHCRAVEIFTDTYITVEPVAGLPVDPLNCDYKDAEQFNGWGWNAIAGIPCPPLIDTNQAAGGDSSTEDQSATDESPADDAASVASDNMSNPPAVADDTQSDQTGSANTSGSGIVSEPHSGESGVGALDLYLLLALVSAVYRRYVAAAKA